MTGVNIKPIIKDVKKVIKQNSYVRQTLDNK